MSNKYIKLKNGINLQPQSVAPTGLEDGDVYHDATQGLMVQTNGVVAPAGGSGGGGTPAGSVIMYAGTTEPSGWVFCYGQAISRTTFSSLFTAIGTTYGVGDGSTTFNLPDLRGRVSAGRDNMGGVAANRLTAGNSGITGTTLGATGGVELGSAHSHDMQHTHQYQSWDAGALAFRSPNAVGTGYFATTWTTGAYSSFAGNLGVMASGAQATLMRFGAVATEQYFTGAPLNNAGASKNSTGTSTTPTVQPTIVLNYIIKT